MSAISNAVNEADASLHTQDKTTDMPKKHVGQRNDEQSKDIAKITSTQKNITRHEIQSTVDKTIDEFIDKHFGKIYDDLFTTHFQPSSYAECVLNLNRVVLASDSHIATKEQFLEQIKKIVHKTDIDHFSVFQLEKQRQHLLDDMNDERYQISQEYTNEVEAYVQSQIERLRQEYRETHDDLTEEKLADFDKQCDEQLEAFDENLHDEREKLMQVISENALKLDDASIKNVLIYYLQKLSLAKFEKTHAQEQQAPLSYDDVKALKAQQANQKEQDSEESDVSETPEVSETSDLHENSQEHAVTHHNLDSEFDTYDESDSANDDENDDENDMEDDTDKSPYELFNLDHTQHADEDTENNDENSDTTNDVDENVDETSTLSSVKSVVEDTVDDAQYQGVAQENFLPNENANLDEESMKRFAAAQAIVDGELDIDDSGDLSSLLENNDFDADTNVDETNSVEDEKDQTTLLDNDLLDELNSDSSSKKKSVNNFFAGLFKSNKKKDDKNNTRKEKADKDNGHKKKSTKDGSFASGVSSGVVGSLVILVIIIMMILGFILLKGVFNKTQTPSQGQSQATSSTEITTYQGLSVGDQLEVSSTAGKILKVTIAKFNNEGAVAYDESNKQYIITYEQLDAYASQMGTNSSATSTGASQNATQQNSSQQTSSQPADSSAEAKSTESKAPDTGITSTTQTTSDSPAVK